MTSQQIADRALAVYWTHRDTDKAILAALLDEALSPTDYLADLEAVRTALSEPESASCCVSKSLITTPPSSSCFSEAF